MDRDREQRVPQRFGAFLIDKVLWRGSISTVYLARDSRDLALVALKVLYPRLGRGLEEQRKSAALEARRLREIAHPNIIELRKHGECEGVPYLSFPYIEGEGLDHLLRLGKPPTSTVLAIMEKVCRALHHAHSKGILHRDLKPRNILLDKHSEPCILDWGLSYRKGQEAKSGFQNIVGTPAYMSPEQARGEEEHLTPASDVYSLGAILYHLLTGEPPFRSDSSWKTLQMAMSLPPSPPTDLQATLDPRAETVVLACLKKEPEQRYASTKALADDLQRVLHNAKPRGPASRLRRFFER